MSKVTHKIGNIVVNSNVLSFVVLLVLLSLLLIGGTLLIDSAIDIIRYFINIEFFAMVVPFIVLSYLFYSAYKYVKGGNL
ncbi:hypothetical protein [Mammaliicoccus phage vB_MscM-PMS3]|nr:hypothetical protein [Mammaliicoccus phage vB_MscM-PMS3]